MAGRTIVAFFVIAYAVSFASPGPAFASDSIPYFVRSPEALVEWLQSEFVYELKFPDRRQAPDETIRRRTGDCEDFAILSRAVLERLGIASDVIIIKFREIGVMHAICIFQRGSTFSFISNKEMIRTRGHSITAAVTEKYPDWEKIIYLTASGDFGKKVNRRYSIDLAANNLAVPSLYGELLSIKHKDVGIIKQVLQEQLQRISRAGMPLNAGTFMTILREGSFDHADGRSLRFLFKDLELTAAGFRTICTAEDSSGVREYTILFSLNRDKFGGFAAAVYSREEWQRLSGYAEAMPSWSYRTLDASAEPPVESGPYELRKPAPAIDTQPHT